MEKMNKPRDDWFSCKICGRPNPDIYKKITGKEAPFEEYLPWTKEKAIEHLKKMHKDVLNEK